MWAPRPSACRVTLPQQPHQGSGKTAFGRPGHSRVDRHAQQDPEIWNLLQPGRLAMPRHTCGPKSTQPPDQLSTEALERGPGCAGSRTALPSLSQRRLPQGWPGRPPLPRLLLLLLTSHSDAVLDVSRNGPLFSAAPLYTPTVIPRVRVSCVARTCHPDCVWGRAEGSRGGAGA